MSNKTETLQLTPRELQVVLAALQAVSPIGGGSEPWTLFRELSTDQKTDGDEYYALVGQMQRDAHQSVVDFQDEQAEQ